MPDRTLMDMEIEALGADFSEAVRLTVDAIEHYVVAFRAWFDEFVESNSYLAALVRQANQRQPRGLAHPGGRRGRARRLHQRGCNHIDPW